MTAINLPITFRGDARTAPGARVNATTVVLVVTCLAVWVVSLSRSLFDPIWLDHAVFRYYAQRVMAGQHLYADLYNWNGPAIVAIHCLSIKLFGSSELTFRVFDACWQLLTLATLVTLAMRDGRGWHVGFLAAVVYMLAYYGFGYTDTAEREGFAVLPMLLAAHAVASERTGGTRTFLSRLFAGAMGLFVFTLKLPLGMCFGALWLHALADAWIERRRGWRALASAVGLSAGFLLSSAVCVLVLMGLGWWSSYVLMLLGQEFPSGLVRGPWAIREMMPRMAIASVLIAGALVCGLLGQRTDRGGRQAGLTLWLAHGRAWMVGLAAFGFLVTLVYWSGWHALFVRVMGLLIPAVGTVLVCTWSGRSRIWRTLMLLGCASLGAVFLQGNFNTYQIHPVLACASYLVACEVVGGLRRFATDPQSARVWTAICLAGVTHLAVCHWWRKMTKDTTAPYVLADMTLNDHYARVTADRDNVPADKTCRRVAKRIRASTAPDEPMACLFTDPRVYFLADRPPVHKVVYVNPDNRHLHEEMIHAICSQRPKVLLARVPSAVRAANDVRLVSSAVFDQVESTFGPPARPLREIYRVAEIIDDVCILEPVRPPGP